MISGTHAGRAGHRGEILALAFLALAFSAGCGEKSPESCVPSRLSSNCRISEDQRNSFRTPLNLSAPTTVTIDERFSSLQSNAIVRAVAEWNAFAYQTLGRVYFQVRVGRVSDTESPKNSDDCEFSSSSASSFAVVKVDSESHWRALSLTDRNPGVTIRCHRTSDCSLTRQAVLINTQYADPSQFASIALHELGHAVGLEHSCELSGAKPGVATCSGLPGDHPYVLAAMFPTLRAAGFTAGELKETLRANDRERAYCLYGP